MAITRAVTNLFIVLFLFGTIGAKAQLPVAKFNYTILNGKPCGQAYVQFVAETGSAFGNPTGFIWTGIGVVSPTNSSPTGHLIGPGNHTVTLVVSNANGPSQVYSQTITVFDTPKVNFTGAPLTGCPPLNVTFNPTGTQPGAPGPATYMWISSPATPTTVTVGSPGTGTMSFPGGTHDVTLKVTNSLGCEKSFKKTAYINVFPDLVSNFSTPTTVFCTAPTPAIPFNPVIVTPTVGPYTALWDFGQGPTVGPIPVTTVPTKVYPPPKGATYGVTMVVSDGNGCKDTVFKPQYITIMDVKANFTGPASACIGTPVTFTSTGTPANGICDWDYGSGEAPDFGVQPGVTHVFVTSGTKTVRLVYTVNGCSDTAYKTIVIHPKPTINFTHNPNPPCPAPSTVTLTATGASQYLWEFGDGTGMQGPATSINHVYGVCGFYTPTLYATDANGCKDTLSKPLLVKVYCGDFTIYVPPPFNRDGCAPHTVKFDLASEGTWSIPIPGGSISPYPSPVLTYDWNFGVTGAPNSNQASPTFTYNNPGVYKVTVKVVTANGCTFYDSLDVYVGSKPNASFLVDTVVCAGQPLMFVNTSTVPGFNGGYIYDGWTFGDKTFVSNPGVNNTTHVYDTAGTFCARLIVDYNSCLDTFVRCNIRVDSPVAKFKYTLDCNNRLTVSFQNASYGYNSFIWYFGDGPTSTSTVLNPVHVYPGYGIYKVKLVTFNNASGCSDTLELGLELFDPVPVLTAPDTTLCKNDSVRFNAVFDNPAGISSVYAWYVDNVFQTSDSIVNYTHKFPTEGYHKVKVIMRDGMGCTDSAVKTNWVLVSKPAPEFTGTPPIGCVPHTVNFTDNSLQVPAAAPPSLPGAPIVSRRWHFTLPSVGVTLPGATATHTYTAVGVYDVKLVVTDASGCKDSITKPAYIQSHKPKALFNVSDTTACLDQVLNFTNLTTTATSAKWYFGDGDSSLVMSPTHAYKQKGIYTVTMIATDAVGCKDTLKKTTHIWVTQPFAAFRPVDTAGLCDPVTVKFDTVGTRDAIKFWWAFDGSSNHPVHHHPIETFFSPGVYKVTYVAIDAFGCTDTAFGNVRVMGYDGAFSYTPLAGCAPLEVTFNMNLFNIPSLIWDFNDGNTLISKNAVEKHIYTIPGAYLPRVIMTDTNGCTAGSLGLDTIKVDGIEADFVSSPLCEGYNVTFRDTSRGMFSQAATWAWTFHNGQSSSVKTPSVYYPKAGTYPVTLIVTSAKGCKDTVTRNVQINELPVISAGGDTIICYSDAAQLLGTGGVSYLWSPATNLSCTNCPDPLASPLVKTIYTVIGTDANKCSDTDMVEVSLKFKVESIVGEGGQICEGEDIKLRVSGAHTYAWTPAALLDSAESATPLASPRSNTTFKVVAFEGSCIPDTNFVDVVVHPKPTVKASGGTTIIAGNEAPLNAEGDRIQSFYWKPGETLNCDDCPNPIAKPIRTTEYTVVATTAYGCSDSADVVVKVLCDQTQLFIPNTFTPNGDGQNDMFYPRGVGFDVLRSLRVFNRWGEIVYERRGFMLNDRSAGWDGNFRGQQLPPDVFMYTVEADCDDGTTMLWKGDVTLIR